ncbi:MAG: 4Fe-4S dicluster domain-containing protein [Candidatus Sumerlaeia bacterium]|nr:4Fe-4S dicluster domain-containing protein [Candidatus Sumerlaeia bacterium]
MKRGIIEWKDFSELVRRWAAEREVIAPVRREAVELSPVGSADEIALDSRNTQSPAKRHFFRPSEALLRFDFRAAPERQVVEAESHVRPAVLCGIRPCEARSLTLLDRVFLREPYCDPYYLRRRENTTVVVLGCTSAGPTCFCTSVGGGPDDRTGADLFLTEIAQGQNAPTARYLLDVVTERGAALLEGFDVVEADAGEIERASRNAIELTATMKTVADLERIRTAAQMAFDDPVWQAICLSCVGCAACAFLCPTCHCFDIQDEVSGGRGQRVRNWDACSFAHFTLHASGHNPRTERHQRCRQRILHKFAWFPENFGAAACVGCGRCIRACPMGNDIRRWLDAIGKIV